MCYRFIISALAALIALAPSSSLVAANDMDRNKKCQIIFIVGIEDPSKHQFTPVIETLARQQLADDSDDAYEVSLSDGTLRSAIWSNLVGLHPNRQLAERVISKVCPDDGKTHVIIEESTFKDKADHGDNGKVQRALRGSTNDLVSSDSSMASYLNSYFKMYAQYAEVKFIMLHRPLLEIMESNKEMYDDLNVDKHAQSIWDSYHLLTKILDTPVDISSPDEPSVNVQPKQWTLVCMERLIQKYYSNNTPQDKTSYSLESTKHMLGRQHVLSYLTNFLGWSVGDCPGCFDTWDQVDEDLAASRLSSEESSSMEGEIDDALLAYYMASDWWPPKVEAGLSFSEHMMCLL